MSLKSNTATGQTLGTTVSITNSDDFGESGFQLVSINGGGTLTYDNTHIRVGSMAFKVAPVASNANYVQYGGSTGDLVSDDVAIDAWFYFTANPTAEFTLINGTATAGGRRLNVNIDSTGKVRARAETTTYLWTSTASIPLNAWFRIRVFSRNQGTGTSFFKVSVLNASNAVVDSFSTSTANRTEKIAGISFGKAGSDASAAVFWMSELKVETAAAGYVGETPPDALAVKTLTCRIDATTSTGDISSYTIAQISGPSSSATVVSSGIWTVPIPTGSEAVWRVTTAGPAGTDTIDVIVPFAGSSVPVEMLYCTAPGVFV